MSDLAWHELDIPVEFTMTIFEGAIQVTSDMILIFGCDSTDCYIMSLDDYKIYEFENEMPIRADIVSLA
jgi:hypothetical protein